MTHAQGQSVVDRLTAAKHSIAGHGLAKSVCKATTEEVMGPKKKHIDYLVACTNEPNVSIPQLANLLIERTLTQNWVIVFKSLITVHNLMNYGNERFTQYLASNNCTFNLSGFKDKTTTGDVTGYDMSTFIRRYSKYLNDKAYSYRQMAFDFCKVKRGKDDGLLRTMNAEKLLKTLPVLQQQVDGLLEFDCTPNELTNGVINAAFMLMFKDLIRLFACYNDGIINLLEKYFEMNKKQCREALDVYKKFLTRMDKVSEFLKTAENVGIDKGDIPDLAKAPSSLLEALEEHLKSLESSKKAGPPAVKPAPASVTSAINSLSGTPDPSSLTEEEKKRILEEEQRTLNDLKERKEKSTNPFAMSPTEARSPTSGGIGDLLGGAGSPTTAAGSGGNDLLNLASTNPFAATVTAHNGGSPWSPPATAAAPPAPTLAAAPVQNGGSPWGPPAATNPTSSMNGTGFGADANFAAAFGDSTAPPASTTTGFDGFGEVMRPVGSGPPVAAGVGVGVSSGGPGVMPAKTKADKLISGDLDSSLMSLAGNLNINGPGQQIKKTDHKWKPSAHGNAPMGSAGTAPSGWAAQPMAGSTFPPAGAPPAPSYQTAMPNSLGSISPGVSMGMSGVPLGMAQPPTMMMNATMQPPQQQPNYNMMNTPHPQQQHHYMNASSQQQPWGGMGVGIAQQPMMGGYPQTMGMAGQPRPGMAAQQPMFGAQQQQQPGAMFGQPQAQQPPQQQQQQPNDPFGSL